MQCSEPPIIVNGRNRFSEKLANRIFKGRVNRRDSTFSNNNERIEQLNSRFHEICRVPCHQGEIVAVCGGGNLTVE